jgi:hypothetical protein
MLTIDGAFFAVPQVLNDSSIGEQAMNRFLTAVSLAAMCSASVLAAQTPTSQPAPQDRKQDHAVTVTGCVAPGAGPSQYILTSATAMPAVADKATPATDKGNMPPGHTMSYTLVGGTDLKAHLGHKVEVSGTLAKPGVPPDASAKPPAGDRASKDMMGGTLTVAAVKMVSATCP